MKNSELTDNFIFVLICILKLKLQTAFFLTLNEILNIQWALRDNK